MKYNFFLLSTIATLLATFSYAQRQKTLEELEVICDEQEGMFVNGACYHFEGTTIKDVVVKDCPGECTNWSGCIEWYPERECEKAEGYYEARYREEEKEGIDWVFYFTFLFVIFSIGGCICMLGVCMAKANGDRPKPVWEINREHFDKHDFKYWDLEASDDVAVLVRLELSFVITDIIANGGADRIYEDVNENDSGNGNSDVAIFADGKFFTEKTSKEALRGGGFVSASDYLSRLVDVADEDLSGE